MNYLLDICVISDFFKKEPKTTIQFKQILPDQIYISTISIMEIEYGLSLNKGSRDKLTKAWKDLLAITNVVDFDTMCAVSSGEIRAKMKLEGNIIGYYDILLAGVALAHNFVLVTSNVKEFKRIQDLSIENWRV